MFSRGKAKNKSQFGQPTRLQFEQLEDRSVLSGCTVAAGVVNSITNTNTTNHVAAQVGSSVAGKATVANSETVLTASLADPNGAGVIGSVIYETEVHNGKTYTELAVVVRGATPGAKLDITITDPNAVASAAAVVLGTITVDANGNGRLFLHSGPKSTTPLPANVLAGFNVNVGTLAGSFAAPPTPTGTVTETHLTTALADPNNTATSGKVEFVNVQGNGKSFTALNVTVKGPGAVDGAIVAIDGVQVGTLKLDSHGVGHLFLSSNLFDLHATPLPANFPTVKLGSVVTVGGTVTGTLAAPAPHGHHHH